MAGVASNLGAALEDRVRRNGYVRMTKREEAPLSEVLRMMAREALTGVSGAARAEKMVAAWRPVVESRLGTRLKDLGKLMRDQDAYAREVRRILQTLALEQAAKANRIQTKTKARAKAKPKTPPTRRRAAAKKTTRRPKCRKPPMPTLVAAIGRDRRRKRRR